jgi:hypothetical protein
MNEHLASIADSLKRIADALNPPTYPTVTLLFGEEPERYSKEAWAAAVCGDASLAAEEHARMRLNGL